MSERAGGVRVDLADDELRMLVLGLTDWGVKEAATERLAAAMGFASIEDLEEESSRIAEALAAHQPLSVRDWTRALVATEIAFCQRSVRHRKRVDRYPGRQRRAVDGGPTQAPEEGASEPAVPRTAC